MSQIQIIGLVVLLLFYGGYFAKTLLLRKKGIVTDRLGKGQKAERTLRMERLLKRSTYAIGLIQLCSVFIQEADRMIPVAPLVKYMGLGVALLGVVLFVLAMRTMQNSWRAGIVMDEQVLLVTQGIYRLSRNPAFLGFDLLYLGFAFAFSNWILMAVSLMGVVLMHLQIKEEEHSLAQVLGEPYLLYKKQTPRYFLFF